MEFAKAKYPRMHFANSGTASTRGIVSKSYLGHNAGHNTGTTVVTVDCCHSRTAPCLVTKCRFGLD